MLFQISITSYDRIYLIGILTKTHVAYIIVRALRIVKNPCFFSSNCNLLKKYDCIHTAYVLYY